MLMFDGFTGKPFDDFHGQQYSFSKCVSIPGLSDSCLLYHRVPMPPSVFITLVKDQRDENFVKLTLKHMQFLENIHVMVVRQIGGTYSSSVSEMIQICERLGAHFREIDVQNEQHRRMLMEYASGLQ